jgi:adenosylcobinamide-phosphate synthase
LDRPQVHRSRSNQEMNGPSFAFRLAAAYVLDLAVGDPEWLPHPVRVIGAAISGGEKLVRRESDDALLEWLKGTLLTLVVVTSSFLSSQILLRRLSRSHPRWRALVETALASTTLATKDLLLEARAVLDRLESGDLQAARTQLSRLVGRHTSHLSETEICRALVETLAESTCDGIAAPLFWLAIGGVPSALAYKAINTLDSMIGHCDSQYRHFGNFAARLDDVANFLPARLSALSIVGASLILGADAQSACQVWLRDGSKHASPNAGQSEAAMAGALGVRLGGANVYEGEPIEAPQLCAEGRPSRRTDVELAIRITATASLLAFGACLALSLWREKTRKREQDGDD